MLLRILTVLVSLPFFLGLLYVGGWPLFVLVTGMGLVGFYEYARLWRSKEVSVPLALGGGGIVALCAWAFLAPRNTALLGAIVTAIVMGVFIWLIFRYQAHTVRDAVVTVAGIFYVGWLLCHLLLLRGLGSGTGWDMGFRWLILAFLCTWVGDSVAYFVGISLGRHKMAPAISPSKSMEGAVGGGIGTVAVGWLWGPVVGVAPWQGALIAGGAYVASVLGDLTESALKRYAGVKDAGRILPGHGGILDRFDSSLFVLPYIYYVAVLVLQHGG